SGVIRMRTASIPNSTFADIQMASSCFIRIFKVALNRLLSNDNWVLAFVLNVVYIKLPFSIPSITSFFSFLESPFTVPADVFASLLAEHADRNTKSIKAAIVLLLIHICFFLYFLMKFFIVFSLRKLSGFLPKIQSLLFISQMKKNISLMFN